MDFKEKKISNLKIKTPLSNSSKSSSQLKKTPLMQEKAKEHEEVFQGAKHNKDDVQSKTIENFRDKTVLACHLLSEINAGLKKSKDEEALRKTALAFLSSAISVCKHIQKIPQSADEDTKDEQSVKNLTNLLSFLQTSQKRLSSIRLGRMDRDEYEKSREMIVDISRKVSEDMARGIKDAKVKEYGLDKDKLPDLFKDQKEMVEKVLKGYVSKSKRLLKTIEAHGNRNTDKMPLMGSEGAS